MARGGQQGDPTDWVTRAADDAIRHAGRRGPGDHLLVGRQPVGPGAPRQPARVPHRPLRRRRAAPPRRPRPPPARVGRLRPLPQGAGRRRPVLGRAHRPAALGGPRPVGVPPVLGRALQGAAARGPARARRGHGGDLPDRALHVGGLPRAGAARRPAPRRHRRGAREVPDQGAGGRVRAGGRGARRLGGRRRGRRHRGDRRARAVPVQALLPRVRARHHPHHGVRRRDDRPVLHLPVLRRSPASPTSPPRTRASWSGRSTGRCGGRSRRSTSSPPAWTTRPPARRSPSATSWCETVFGMPRPAWFGYGFVGFAGRAEDVVLEGRRADRGRRAEGDGGADPALALRPPAARSRRSTSTSAPRSSGCTTSGTRSAGRPPTRRSGTPPCWPRSGPPRPRPPARCRPRRSSCRSAPCPRWPT